MRLELRDDGAMLLRDVGDEAWEYINEERAKLPNPGWQHWLFSENRYEGTVYVTATPEEDKCELVRITDALIDKYGMELQGQALPVLQSWRREAAYAWHTSRNNESLYALKGQLDGLKAILKEGCVACGYFRLKRNGDGLDGYCEACGKALAQTIFDFGNGKTVDGISYPGTKYYPFSECKICEVNG